MTFSPKLLSAAILLSLAGTAAAAPADRALSLIQANPNAFKASPSDRFIVRSQSNNGLTSTVRVERTYKGLDVLEGDMVLVLDNAGSLKNANMTLRAPLNLSTRPSISRDDAIVAAGAVAGDFSRLPSAKLIVSNHGTSPTLAWKVRVESDTATGVSDDVTYYIGAGPSNGGKLLFSTANNQTAGVTGTGKTMYSGNVPLATNSTPTGFEMRDVPHGNSYTTDFKNGGTSKPGTGTIFTGTTNVWGNNDPVVSDRQTAGADAHFGVGKTWEFYATLGRNGIDGTGRQSYNRVHVGRSYVNAFWSDNCFCMSYGDGDGVTYGPLVDLDVAGHEMSHGVMSKEAALTYSGESGGLNEANSDIMGTMVEFYANNALDTPDYLIGEELYLKNVSGDPGQKALRYMFHPSLEGASRSVDCYSSTIGSLDVHYSSGPANHFFYLLAEGNGANTFSGVDHTSPTCNGSAHAGIGRPAATQIWYVAVRDYMTSGTKYAGARTATLQAAVASGYGVGSPVYNAVAAAWSAVSVP